MRERPKDATFCGAEIPTDLWQRIKWATIARGLTLKGAMRQAFEMWLKRKAAAK